MFAILTNKSYVQVLKANIKEIFKIKDAFSKLSFDKVLEIHNVMNKLLQDKPKLSMTTRDSSRKQIIIPIKINNIERVIVQSNIHIANIN